MRRFRIILLSLLIGLNLQAQFLINPYSYGGVFEEAKVALSVRKVRESYTGDCMRIRRSSDNAESDIGFVDGLLDTAAIMSFTGTNSAFVTKWYSQGTTTYSVTQTTTALQPRIVNAGVLDTKNGLPAVYFNGAYYMDNQVSSILNTTNMSYYSVSSNTVSNSVGAVFSQSWNTAQTIRVFCDRRVEKRNMAITNSAITNYYANMSIQRDNSDQRLLSSFIDGSSNMSGFDNGATGGTDTWTGVITNNGFTVGMQGGALTRLTGYIQEIIIFNTDNSSSRTAIEANINDYYTIY